MLRSQLNKNWKFLNYTIKKRKSQLNAAKSRTSTNCPVFQKFLNKVQNRSKFQNSFPRHFSWGFSKFTEFTERKLLLKFAESHKPSDRIFINCISKHKVINPRKPFKDAEFIPKTPFLGFSQICTIIKKHILWVSWKRQADISLGFFEECSIKSIVISKTLFPGYFPKFV